MGELGVEDHLHRAPAVAEVDEDQPAVVAAARHPAVELHLPAGVGRAQGPAVGRAEAAHDEISRSGRSAQATSACSPLVISRSWTTLRAPSSRLKMATQRAPALAAARILARRLRSE